MVTIESGKEPKVKKSEREVLIVGELPADVVAEIEAAEYGVPTPATVSPAPPPSPSPRLGRP